MNVPRPPLHTDYLGGDERLFWACEDMVFGEVTVPANFLSDGLSIPSVFHSFFAGGKSPRYIPTGMLHDYLYKINEFPEMTRKQADKIFLIWLKRYRVKFLTRHIIHKAVRVGARKSWKVREPTFYQGDHNGL